MILYSTPSTCASQPEHQPLTGGWVIFVPGFAVYLACMPGHSLNNVSVAENIHFCCCRCRDSSTPCTGSFISQKLLRINLRRLEGGKWILLSNSLHFIQDVKAFSFACYKLNMHTIAHIVTAFMLGLYLHGSSSSISPKLADCILLSFVSIFVDFDGNIRELFGCFDSPENLPLIECMFDHGRFTHTLVFVAMSSLLLWTFKLLLYRLYSINSTVITLRFILLVMCSHLVLDIVTYNEPCTDTHLYAWPLSNVAFHINCLFVFTDDDTSKFVRFVVEWCFYHPTMWFTYFYKFRGKVSFKFIVGDIMVLMVCYVVGNKILLITWLCYNCVYRFLEENEFPPPIL